MPVSGVYSVQSCGQLRLRFTPPIGSSSIEPSLSSSIPSVPSE